MHGNTALHYLAGHRVVNDGLVEMMKGCEGGEEVWKCQSNRWGFTPQDLWEDGKAAVEEPHNYFWEEPPSSVLLSGQPI